MILDFIRAAGIFQVTLEWWPSTEHPCRWKGHPWWLQRQSGPRCRNLERSSGEHGVESCNYNGRLLLEFCAELQLTITDTIFQQKDSLKTTWMHPRYKRLIDYFLMRQRDHSGVLHTWVMSSTECHTDHRLVRCMLKFHFKPMPKPGGPSWINLQSKLEDPDYPTDPSPETL